MTKQTNDMWERLDREAILRGVTDTPISIYAEEEVDSTSDVAKRHILSGGGAPAVFLAERQTLGRGRMGRSFYSPEGTGLYLSLVIPVDRALADAVFLTTAAAVSVHQAIASVTGIETQIKWVNDLYYQGRKVCGILAESFLLGDERFLILGVGINLSTQQFPDEIRDLAGSLLPSSHGVRNRLASAVIGELFSAVTGRLDRDLLMKTYCDHSMVLGKEIVYTENGEAYEGRAVAIDERGGLLVERADGARVILRSGEITLRLKP